MLYSEDIVDHKAVDAEVHVEDSADCCFRRQTLFFALLLYTILL